MLNQAHPAPSSTRRPLRWIWASTGWCRSGKATSSRCCSFSSSNSRCSSEMVSCRSVVTCSRSCFSCCRLCSNSCGRRKAQTWFPAPLGTQDRPKYTQQVRGPSERTAASHTTPALPAGPVAGIVPVPYRSEGSAAFPPTQPAGPQPPPDFPAALPAPGPDSLAAVARSSAWPAGTECEWIGRAAVRTLGPNKDPGPKETTVCCLQPSVLCLGQLL